MTRDNSSEEADKLTGSIGVQHAPRQKTAIPLTFSEKSPSSAWITIVRNPIGPVSNSTSSWTLSSVTTNELRYRAGSPWVCGHQRSTSSTSIDPTYRIPPAAGRRWPIHTRSPRRELAAHTTHLRWPRGSKVDNHVQRALAPMHSRLESQRSNIDPAELLEPYASPWADRCGRGRPARRTTEKSCSNPTQLLVGHHRRAPSWSRAPSLKELPEASATNQQFVIVCSK